jgi:hypothetical protein
MNDERAEGEILNDYIDLVNARGLESVAELAFLRRHAASPETLRLLSAARALKAVLASSGPERRPGGDA